MAREVTRTSQAEPLHLVSLSPDQLAAPVYRRYRDRLPSHHFITAGTTSEDVDAVIEKADYLIGDWTGRTPITAQRLQAAKHCRAFFQPTAGYESVDVAAAHELGIPVANAPGANSRAVAEWTVLAILSQLKAVVPNHSRLADGQWRMVEATMEGTLELGGRTVGIIGFGAIGQAVAARLAGFELSEILYYDVVQAPADVEHRLGVRRAGIDEICAASDAISLHVPLVESTSHLIDRRRLELLGPDGVLINAARGPVVDEDALQEALRSGTLRAAALDVFTDEPLTPGHRWSDEERVLLSPHLAGSTAEACGRMFASAFDNLLGALSDGNVRNSVNGIEEQRSY